MKGKNTLDTAKPPLRESEKKAGATIRALAMMKGMKSPQNHGDKSGTSAAREPEQRLADKKMSPSIEMV
jgi:hypothetical protein